jgi:sporulation protein YlmC with PRC-barrel domain
VADQIQFAVGAKASCSDGPCGEVRRMIVDPASDTVTHLVIESGHGRHPGRLVPLDLLDTTSGEIKLRCTRAEFNMLEHAERKQRIGGRDGGLTVPLVRPGPVGALSMQAPGGSPASRPARFIVEEVVPAGEAQVRPGDQVDALDGEIGRVQGLLVDPDDHRVTHVLLREGHLWGRKQVAIPVSAVTGIKDGIRLNITKQQVENLPPVDIDRSGSPGH